MNGLPAATSHSMRDPDGRLFSADGRLLRLVAPAAAKLELTERAPIRGAMERGAIVKTWRAAAADLPQEFASAVAAGTVVLEHERLPFVSYPCEWSPLTLCDAALHTLEMQQLALADGMILKDATPNNILFRGCRPVFVDFLSFAERERGDYFWRARHQFDACFLLPLLLNLEAGIPISWSLRDFLHGVPHEAARRILGIKCWFKPALISAVALPAALSRQWSAAGATYAARRRFDNDARALFALQHQAEVLQRRLSGLRSRLASVASRWATYTHKRAHYTEDELEVKRRFVREALVSAAPQVVLDLGANTGEFSQLAAGTARVIAIDIDENSASAIANRASRDNLDIHVLVGNLTQPTPAEGWRNAESRALLDRLASGCDLLLVLALVHHLRITGGIPFVEIIDLLAFITRRYVVFELVPPGDVMFAAMARGREALYEDCQPARVEEVLAQHFRELRRQTLPNGRVLMLLEKR